jgi:lipopolysaccharide transport system permease protein
VGLWVSALNVQYRDVRYAIPFLARIWFFATPIVYPVSKVGEKLGHRWETIYSLNPMTGAVEGFRWAIFGGGDHPSLQILAISSAATLVLLVGGLYYFRRMEQTFADVV